MLLRWGSDMIETLSAARVANQENRVNGGRSAASLLPETALCRATHRDTSDAGLSRRLGRQRRTMTVEIEGEDKPALVAEWISRLIYS